MKHDFRRKVLFTLAAAVLLAVPPLLGVVLAGKPLAQYLEFPPDTLYVQHAAFSWAMFWLVLVCDLMLIGLLAAALRKASAATREIKRSTTAESAGHFPWWGWGGLGLCAAFWVLAWHRFPWFEPLQMHTFTPLWLGFIITVNALVHRRRGSCLMTRRPGRWLLLFLGSAVFWWFFEYLNRFVQNWYYVGVEQFNTWQYLLFASLSFSTVLPAVVGVCELLFTCPLFSDGLRCSPRFICPRAGVRRERSSQPRLSVLCLSGLFQTCSIRCCGSRRCSSWWRFRCCWDCPA